MIRLHRSKIETQQLVVLSGQGFTQRIAGRIALQSFTDRFAGPPSICLSDSQNTIQIGQCQFVMCVQMLEQGTPLLGAISTSLLDGSSTSDY